MNDSYVPELAFYSLYAQRPLFRNSAELRPLPSTRSSVSHRTARLETQDEARLPALRHFQGIRFGFSSVLFGEYRESKLLNPFTLCGKVAGIFSQNRKFNRRPFRE